MSSCFLELLQVSKTPEESEQEGHQSKVTQDGYTFVADDDVPVWK